MKNGTLNSGIYKYNLRAVSNIKKIVIDFIQSLVIDFIQNI